MIHCPSCGGGLRFDIKTQKMACDLCDSHFEPNEVDTARGDSKEVSAGEYDAAVHICPSCGAELMTNDENDAVGFCPFCGGASMLFSQIRQRWKPDVVIPFQLTKEQCKQIYYMETVKSPFVSRKYRDPALIDSFRGIYMPYWIIDAEYDGDYRMRVTAMEDDEDSSDVITDYIFAGHAKGTLCYVHDASVNFSDDISEALAPYSFAKAKDFSEGYLSGFYTEISDSDAADYEERVDETLAVKQADALSADPELIKGVKKESEKFKVLDAAAEEKMEPKEIRVRRALFPVWFMSKRSKNRVTYAAVNGDTGRVAVDLPLSPLRILLTALGAGALLFLVSFLFPVIQPAGCLGACAVLTTVGQVIMEKAYQKALEVKLNILSKKQSVYPWMMMISFLLTLSMWMIYREMIKYVIIVFGAVFLLATIVFIGNMVFRNRKRINEELKKPLAIKYKADLTQKIKKYRIAKWIFFIIEFLLVAATIAIFVMRLPSAMYMYGLCFLMAANLFASAIAVIRFQDALSTRRPPQMDKKGALYDEN